MTKSTLRDSMFQPGWENVLSVPPLCCDGSSENDSAAVKQQEYPSSFNHESISIHILLQDKTCGIMGTSLSSTVTTTPPATTMHTIVSPFKTAAATPPSSPGPWKAALLMTPSPTATVSTSSMTPMSNDSNGSYQLSTPPVMNGNAAIFTPGTEAMSIVGGSHPHRSHREMPTSPVLTTAPQKHVSPTKQRSSPTKKKPTTRGSNKSSKSPPTDTSHQKKIKTELCMHYMQKGTCPWGDTCTYAHGESELQHQTLRELQRKGLLDDVEKYRIKPCFAYTSMGSCPFGRRCVSIHDPRSAGKVASWLPLTETQGNNIATDINVEGLHQKRHYSILSGNPFGEEFSVELDDFNDLYKLVTNHTEGASHKRRRNTISEVHKLSMALQMRQSNEWMYKFCPHHVIFQEMCMVLQQKAFVLESDDSGNAVPIPLQSYKASNSKHVMVHELAFGPDADPSVRGVALWFNIPAKEIVECTAHQAKRFRWKKTSKFDNVKTKVSPFDLRECFTMIRPHDQGAFDLCTEVLEHRFATVKTERLTTMGDRFELLKQLKSQRGLLQEKFERQKRDWIAWTYPINNGRQRVDEDTPVPPVDAEYEPIIDTSAMDQGVVVGSAIQGIWSSFVTTMTQMEGENAGNTEQHGSGIDKPSRFTQRLPIFVRLGRGESICPDRKLPHINTCVIKKKRFNDLKASAYAQQSERCWKSLLLVNHNGKNGSTSEWDIVKDHFQNFSRSKKVLSMIQQ